MKDYKCRLCTGSDQQEAIFHGRKALMEHQSSVHGVIHRGKMSVSRLPAMDAILAGVSQIRNALKDVDAERNIIQQKLIDLDNLAAKYRKLI